MWIVLEATIDTHHIARSVLPITPRTIDLPLKLDDGRLSLSLKILDHAIFALIEIEAHFVLECPLYNSIRDEFPSLFENVVLGSLKSFFHLIHQVDIGLYLTEASALHHSRELAGLKPTRCTSQSHGFPDFKNKKTVEPWGFVLHYERLQL